MRFSDVPITQQQSWASASHFYFLRTSWMQEEQRADLRENSPLRTVGGLFHRSREGLDLAVLLWQKFKSVKRRTAVIKFPNLSLGFGSRAKKIVRTPCNPTSHYIHKFTWNTTQMVSQKHTHVCSELNITQLAYKAGVNTIIQNTFPWHFKYL